MNLKTRSTLAKHNVCNLILFYYLLGLLGRMRFGSGRGNKEEIILTLSAFRLEG